MSDEPAETGDPAVHLQRAAREMIAAARAFLDVAEKVVDDPGAVNALTTTAAGVLGGLVKSFQATVNPAADEPEEPVATKVTRIRLD